ncbi:LPXTG cell wall anchor domain-containing protein [Streptococcus cuniculi]|nr:LPXTG cell wall anchor domain-containing protein [Streptococcus cuniculi]
MSELSSETMEERSTRRLPNTGENSSSQAGLLGAGILFGALLAKKKKKKAEDKD